MKKIKSRNKWRYVTKTDPLNIIELAQYVELSRWTIQKYVRKQGYLFEFGNRTTVLHFEAWLRKWKERENAEHESRSLISA